MLVVAGDAVDEAQATTAHAGCPGVWAGEIEGGKVGEGDVEWA